MIVCHFAAPPIATNQLSCFHYDSAQTDKLTDQQFQQLGKLLSTSFFTIMEFADVSLLLVCLGSLA
jgi:NADH:ubiquinone oxidoreductase subunit 6 (subunit J)